MAKINIIVFLTLLALTTNVYGQFYDALQNYRLMLKMPTKISDVIVYPQAIAFPGSNQKNRDTPSSLSLELEASVESIRKKLSIDELYNLNYYTTPRPIRKTTKKTTQPINSNIQQTTYINSYIDSINKRKDTSLENNRPRFDKHTNMPEKFQDTKSTSLVDSSVTRPNYVSSGAVYSTARPNVATTEPNFVNTRPKNMISKPNIHATRPNYTTIAGYKPNIDKNYYTTPSTIRPGVKPAKVDINQPPITNRPSNVNDFPELSDVPIKPDYEDKGPEIVMGPDEHVMSSAKKRRYVELLERMCDKFKSFNVRKLEAIPLVPSPEPVQVNVSVCQPAKIPLVVGGKVVSIQEFPHMALLGWTNLQGGGYSWKCGGSLISDRYVLTAGHCTFQDKDDTVVNGAPRVVQLGSSFMDDRRALLVKVEAAIRHPKYIRTRSYFDVAMLKLAKTVTFSDVIKPACLGESPGTDQPIIATGWGKTEFAGSQSLELRSVSIPVWDFEECRIVIGPSRKLPHGPSGDSQICAGEKQGGKDTCQGDSGGPAQIQDGCIWRIVAVTSLGISCGVANTPALYATVHKAFIGAQIFGRSYGQDNYLDGNGDNKQYNENNNIQDNNGNTSNTSSIYQGVLDDVAEIYNEATHDNNATNNGHRHHSSHTTISSQRFNDNENIYNESPSSSLENHNKNNVGIVNSNGHNIYNYHSKREMIADAVEGNSNLINNNGHNLHFSQSTIPKPSAYSHRNNNGFNKESTNTPQDNRYLNSYYSSQNNENRNNRPKTNVHHDNRYEYNNNYETDFLYDNHNNNIYRVQENHNQFNNRRDSN